MLRPYRDVLRVPGSRGFVAAGALARFPMSMVGLGIVLLLSSTTGSYGTAGAVAAVFGVTSAAAAPVLAALVDRFGQARVMRPAIAVHVVGVVALVVLADGRAHLALVVACAVVAGAGFGSMGALVRARWNHALRDEPGRLHTAYSLESVLDEVSFIGGPLVVTLLATGVSPVLGLLVAAVVVVVGGSLLLAQRRTEPPPTGVASPPGTGVLRAPGMVVLVVVFVAVGAVFGSVEVVTVAFTQERGVPAAAGWVLASFAFGSLVAGLAYGAVQWRSPTGTRFRVGVVLLALGVVPVALVQDVVLLAVVVAVAGLAISPMIIAGNGLVTELVPRTRLTEGLTWVATSIGLGVSSGSALGGHVVDVAGAHRAFLVTVGAGALAAAVALAGSRWLAPRSVPVAVPRGA